MTSLKLPPLPTLTYDPYPDDAPKDSGIVDFFKVKLTDDGKQPTAPTFRNPAIQVSKPRTVHGIINLFGGGGKNKAAYKTKALDVFKKLLKDNDITFVDTVTTSVGHATTLAKELPADCECIVVWGGDGTVQEVIQGLMERPDDLRLRASVALVPAGSGNGLAIKFGMCPNKKNPVKDLELNAANAARAIVAGKVHGFDLIKVSYPKLPDVPPQYSALIASWGNTTSLFLHAEQLRRRFGMGESRYVIAVMYRMFIRSYPARARLRIIVDDAYELEYPEEWLARNIYPNELTCCNMPTMSGLQMSPLASCDDGKLEINLAPRFLSKRKLVTAVQNQASGKSVVGQSAVHQRPVYFRFNKVHVDFYDKPNRATDSYIAMDGTLIEEQDRVPFVIECVPSAIRVAVSESTL